MLTVPVRWVPEGALAGGRDVSKSVAVRDQRQKIDVAVEAVRKALFSSSEYSRSSIDYGEYKRLYMEWQGIEDGLSIINPDSMKPSPSPITLDAVFSTEFFPATRLAVFNLPPGTTSLLCNRRPGLRALVNVQELKMLIGKDLVSGVELDGVVVPMLADSTASDLIASEEMSNFLGVDGTGTAVAILDTVPTSITLRSFMRTGQARLLPRDVLWLTIHVPMEEILIFQLVQYPLHRLERQRNDNLADFGCDHGTHVAGIAVGKRFLLV